MNKTRAAARGDKMEFLNGAKQLNMSQATLF
jgi:hypothetical protein